MVGNDVVDLGDRESQPETLHPRFDGRVFTVDELRLIHTRRSSNQMRWMLWACKESAFKLVKRRRPSTVFSPRAFEVEINGSGTAWAHHHGSTVDIKIARHGGAIHAVAAWNRDEGHRIISGVGKSRANPSDAVRELACQHLARVFSCRSAEIEIASGPDRIPKLLVGGRESQRFISLSHHGRFVAFACSLVAEPT